MEAKFQEAADRIKPVTGLSYEEMLKLYSRFKQATVGDCNTSRPGMFDPKGRAKWDAWDAVKGQSKEQAMEEYIAEVERIMAAQG